MRGWLAVFAACALLGCARGLPAPSVPHVAHRPMEEPFEPALAAPRSAEAPGPSGFSPVADAMHWAIEHYQTDIGPHSIQRCPFHVSCSQFAKEAIGAHGALGILWFMDRFFYREHGAVTRQYPRVREADGTLRLDDAARELL